MIDREKVIEILEKAKMVIEDWVPMFEQYNTPAGIDVAIALLKEQEPIEPKVEPAIVPTFKVYSCGHCDTIFHLARQKYCANCGKQVKWDET